MPRVSRTNGTVGARVRQLREARGLSREQLGVYAGTSASTVRNIEDGRKSPTLRSLEGIAQALGVNVTTLLKPARAEARAS